MAWGGLQGRLLVVCYCNGIHSLLSAFGKYVYQQGI